MHSPAVCLPHPNLLPSEVSSGSRSVDRRSGGGDASQQIDGHRPGAVCRCRAGGLATGSAPAEPPGSLNSFSAKKKPPLQSISACPPSHNGWSSPAQAVRTDLELKPYHSTRMRRLDRIGLCGVKLVGVREITPPE